MTDLATYGEALVRLEKARRQTQLAYAALGATALARPIENAEEAVRIAIWRVTDAAKVLAGAKAESAIREPGPHEAAEIIERLG